jgi:hypothetical protein
MSTTKRPFSKDEFCPVVQHRVFLSGLRVSLPGAAGVEVANKMCSNIESCLAKHGSIEQIPNCLLHALRA